MSLPTRASERHTMRTLLVSLCSLSVTWVSLGSVGVALPPPDDLPEEVLRTQIILEGRSPITGAPLTPAERASLEASLTANVNSDIELSPQVREAIWLLSVRKGIRLLFPFLRLPISGN